MTKSRAALLSLILSFLILPVEAATYYVRKDGNDRNFGTTDTAEGAWLTIGKATTAVKPGDTVHVRRGTYQEYVTLTRFGSLEAPISWIGERDTQGNHLTIVDPSIVVTGDWITAPEIGANVYKLSFNAFTPAHLSADDHVVMQFKLYDNAHLDLARDSDSTISNSQWSTPQPFWDGIEAGWTYTNEFIYLRFRDNSTPESHRIKVSDNQDGVRYEVNQAACMIKASYNRISGFVFQGTPFPVALVGDSTYKEIVGNIVESNKVQQGFGQIILIGSGDPECEVSRNIIRHNFLQHKGYWEKAGVGGGAVRYGDDASWPNYQYYWGTKYRWYAYTGSGIEHSHIMLYDIRDNNVIEGNTFTNGVHGLWYISDKMLANNITATGTVIASNKLSNLSGSLINAAAGHDLLYIHDNQIRNAWLGVARLQAINRPRSGQNRVYIYRNQIWNPPDKGSLGYFHLYNETDTYQSEIWIYHNSYEGGNGGMSLSAWAASLPTVLGKVAFLNNIICTGGEPIGSKYLPYSTSLRGYDYNRSRSIPNRPWIGGNNVVLDDYEWGGSSPALSRTNWELNSDSASVNSGLNVSVPFAFMGKNYPALPGFASGYNTSVRPNLGAVQGRAQEPATPEPEEPVATFLTSLDAADALLLDGFMSLHGADVRALANTQDNSPAYVTSSSPDRGSAHFHPTVPSAGTYTIWCRVMTTGSEADSFHVSINGGTERIFESRTWAPVWHWTRLGTFQSSQPERIEYAHYLRGSVNEISFRCRDANTMLSRLLITNDAEFVPAEVAANRVAVRIRQTNYGQILKWPSTAGTPYHVLYSPDFKSHPWTVAGEPIVAGGPETEWLAPKSQLDTGFYWVHAGN